jgi:hypothetical protein
MFVARYQGCVFLNDGLIRLAVDVRIRVVEYQVSGNCDTEGNSETLITTILDYEDRKTSITAGDRRRSDCCPDRTRRVLD